MTPGFDPPINAEANYLQRCGATIGVLAPIVNYAMHHSLKSVMQFTGGIFPLSRIWEGWRLRFPVVRGVGFLLAGTPSWLAEHFLDEGLSLKGTTQSFVGYTS